MNDGQFELFHPDRSSPATVAALLRLPEANARSFAIASALGRFFDQDGSFASVSKLRDIAGTFIGETQRARILIALDIGSRRWRQLVADWERRYVAHRCGPNGVTLFAKPLLDVCPVCKAYIEIVETAPNPAARRNGSTSSTKAERAEVVLPPNGTNTSGGAEPTVPLSGTKPLPPKSGDHQGMVVRDGDSGLEDVSEERFTKTTGIAQPRSKEAQLAWLKEDEQREQEVGA